MTRLSWLDVALWLISIGLLIPFLAETVRELVRVLEYYR